MLLAISIPKLTSVDDYTMASIMASVGGNRLHYLSGWHLQDQ